MGRWEMIVSGLLALATASSAPWWWTRVFPEKPAEASLAAEPDPPLPPAVPQSPPPSPPDTSTSAPNPPPPLPPQPASGDCEGKWYLQMASGSDREGLKGIVDRIRAVGGAFAETGLYTTSRGVYAVSVGCFERFKADELKDELSEKRLLEKSALVTQGQSLSQQVY